MDHDLCADCGSDDYDVLKETPQNVTVQCTECHAVRSFSPRRSRIIELNTVVSDGDRSWNVDLPTPDDEVIAVDDEFELEGHRMIVTTVEVDGQQRPPKAKASEVKTLFAKVFDTVPLKLSMNEGETTRSFQLTVEPEFEVPIGLVLEVNGELWVVKTLKSDQNRTLHRGFLFARNVRRAFCDPAPRRAKPGQVTQARRRGAPMERKGEAPAKRLKGPRGQRSRTPKRS